MARLAATLRSSSQVRPLSYQDVPRNPRYQSQAAPSKVHVECFAPLRNVERQKLLMPVPHHNTGLPSNLLLHDPMNGRLRAACPGYTARSNMPIGALT